MKETNRKKLIILSVVIIITSLYLFVFKEKTENIAIPIVYESETSTLIEGEVAKVKSGFQFPITFMGVYIEKLNPKSKNAIAEAILGVDEGDPMDKDRIISELQLSRGTSLYEFESLLPHSKDTTFYVTMNTENNTLETVRVTQILHSKEKAEEELIKLVKIFEQNYHLVFKDNNYTYLKNRYGDLMIVHLKPIGNDKYELRLDGIFVRRKK